MNPDQLQIRPCEICGPGVCWVAAISEHEVEDVCPLRAVWRVLRLARGIQIGRAVHIHALIEVRCTCGRSAHRVGLVPVRPDGSIDVDAGEVVGPVRCNVCVDAEQRAEADRVKKARAARVWRKKNAMFAPAGRPKP